VKAGSRVVFAEVELSVAGGETLARGGGSFLIQRRD
jgi:acyl-coenzyme A thioesterase PaaI-like protein